MLQGAPATHASADDWFSMTNNHIYQGTNDDVDYVRLPDYHPKLLVSTLDKVLSLLVKFKIDGAMFYLF